MKTKVKIKKISNHILNFLTKFIALGLFSGRIPKAPGTFGSIVGIIISVFFCKTFSFKSVFNISFNNYFRNFINISLS